MAGMINVDLSFVDGRDSLIFWVGARDSSAVAKESTSEHDAATSLVEYKVLLQLKQTLSLVPPGADAYFPA